MCMTKESREYINSVPTYEGQVVFTGNFNDENHMSLMKKIKNVYSYLF